MRPSPIGRGRHMSRGGIVARTLTGRADTVSRDDGASVTGDRHSPNELGHARTAHACPKPPAKTIRRDPEVEFHEAVKEGRTDDLIVRLRDLPKDEQHAVYDALLRYPLGQFRMGFRDAVRPVMAVGSARPKVPAESAPRAFNDSFPVPPLLSCRHPMLPPILRRGQSGELSKDGTE